ncbi:MAG TPA: FAD-dependent oxidoreductase [Solirubrobacter sp.]|nr:FAD-dependent oxidoreductase [Solirubrobacter sp.]
MQRLVIVGASLAGLRAAQAARAAGFDGSVVVIGDEPHVPYTRPPLSKELLAGAHTPEQVAFPCDRVAAEWKLGVAATRLDREAREVVLAGGERVPYDRLIVATGTRARPWPGGGDVRVLRTLDDALALKSAFTAGPRVAIIGAGFIGCEVAAAARKHALEVTLIDVAATPMTPLGPELGERCAQLHRDHGVDLPARADRLEILECSPDGRRLVAAGAKDGRLIGVVAFNAARRLGWYRRQLVAPPAFDDLRATVAADDSALGAMQLSAH